jgi:hypothetical protein
LIDSQDGRNENEDSFSSDEEDESRNARLREKEIFRNGRFDEDLDVTLSQRKFFD